MAEERNLPGWPSKTLVKKVRGRLNWFGIRPITRWSPTGLDIWKLAWQWAERECFHYKRKRWPSPDQIADRYVFLLFHEMRANAGLRPDKVAMERMPDEVRALMEQAEAIGKGRQMRVQTAGVAPAKGQLDLFQTMDLS